jgi:hypothetical protein
MQDVLRDLLKKRINRASAIILGVKEREIDALLKSHPQGKHASDKLRKVVLDQLNELHDLCIDLFGSLDNGEVILNEDYLKKLDQIHTAVVRQDLRSLEQELETSNGETPVRHPLRA